MKLKFIIGIVLTLIWLIASVLLFLSKTSIVESSVGELGNFLAGFVSPVALLWLVYGYIQQGYELQQNTKILEKQRQEYATNLKLFANSTLQQAYLAKASYLNELARHETDKKKVSKYVGNAILSKDASDEIVDKVKKLLGDIESKDNF